MPHGCDDLQPAVRTVSEPVAFPGHNRTLAAPKGEENVQPLPIFGNGTCCVSCWQLSAEELAEVIESGGKVFISIFMGKTLPPVFVGSESTTRGLIADYGVWKR
jgi:hypothetical protein